MKFPNSLRGSLHEIQVKLSVIQERLVHQVLCQLKMAPLGYHLLALQSLTLIRRVSRQSRLFPESWIRVCRSKMEGELQS
jgi:uncharacterized protein (UPF0262 family)